MIIARAPYRVSFAGGGSDLPAYCDREPGFVVSCAIWRHVYVELAPRVDGWIRLRYGSEDIHVNPKAIESIPHPIIRTCLEYVAVPDPLEIVITGEVPGGTGLGSSSALTVALLAALWAYRGRSVNDQALAQQACLIEMGLLRKPIGRQDQYASAYGGLNAITFKARGNTQVEPISLTTEARKGLERHCLLCHVNGQRSADEILVKQSAGMAASMRTIGQMVGLAHLAEESIRQGDWRTLAAAVEESWQLKRSLGCGISNDAVDTHHRAAMDAGAWGAKLLGAGGGGYLLAIAPPERHKAIYLALGCPPLLPFKVCPRGAEVVFSESQSFVGAIP